MSNSPRHKDKRRRRAKQKAKEGYSPDKTAKRERDKVWQMRKPIENREED